MRIPRVQLPHGPAGFQMAVAAWSGCNGLSLLLTKNAFQATPIWISFRALSVPEDVWGWAMLIYGSLTFACLLMAAKSTQAALAAIGALLWGWIGWNIMVGALSAGLVSSGGMFSVLVAVGCIVSVTQYGHEDG